MVNCQVDYDGETARCAVCGWKKPLPGAVLPIYRECGSKRKTATPPCVRLGAAVLYRSGDLVGTPVTVEVTCDTCQGRKRVPQAVFACEKLGRCLPHWRPDDKTFAEYSERPDAFAAVCARCPHREPTP